MGKVIQIPLMQEIYRKAELTHFWLGKGSESSDRATDYLERRAALARRLPLTYLSPVSRKNKMREMFRLEMRAWKDVFGRKSPKEIHFKSFSNISRGLQVDSRSSNNNHL